MQDHFDEHERHFNSVPVVRFTGIVSAWMTLHHTVPHSYMGQSPNLGTSQALASMG